MRKTTKSPYREKDRLMGYKIEVDSGRAFTAVFLLAVGSILPDWFDSFVRLFDWGEEL